MGHIQAPISIAISPSDYVYVLNDTANNVGSWYAPTSTMSTYLYVLKFIPKGYLNMTSNPPSAVTANSPSGWESVWKKYWQISGTSQSYNLYLVKVYNLSNVSSGFWNQLFGGSYSNSCTGDHCINDFAPTAMTTDYAGDVFAVGDNAGTLSRSDNPAIELAGVLANGTVVANNNVDTPGSSFPGAGWVGSIASDAGGSYVYIPNYTGDILAYSVKGNFSPAGTIPLSYSPTAFTANMATAEYMAHGGQFGNTTIASFYANAIQENSNGPLAGYALVGLGNDTPGNHDPITIAGYQGLIYVLDLWTFNDCVLNPGAYNSLSAVKSENNYYSPCPRTTLGPHNPYYDNLSSSILMLRVFFPNGTEVRINPVTNYSDLVASNTMALGFINAGKGSYFNNADPPYGWPLSANLSYIGNTVNQDGIHIEDGIKTITYCAAGCNFTPANLITPYEPIGPMIPNNTDTFSSPMQTTFDLSIDYNGNAYLLGNVSSGCSESSYVCSSMYTELAAFKAPVYNYSKISFMSNATYVCYLDSQSYSANTPCLTPSNSPGSTYNMSEAANLTNMRGPFIEMPSAFSYAESQGSPSIYQSAVSAFSNLGISSSSQCSGGSSQQSSTSTTSTTTTIPYNSIGENSIPATAPGLAASYTYINTSIGGAFLVPLHYEYTINRQWSNPTCEQIYANNGVPTGGQCATTLSQGAITLDTVNLITNLPFGKSTSSTRNIYAMAGYPVHTSSLNYSIQGGATLLQYLTNGNLYNANLSDRNAILPPLINYNLLTDRLIGSTYILQTVNPENNLTSPLMVNYSRVLNYGTQTYSINSSFGTNEMYQIGLSNSITPATGAAASGLSGTSSSPYGSYPGPSQINLTDFGPGVNAPFTLFSIYRHVSYSDSFAYSLLGSKQALGYDRLVYMITDEFGNLLKAPIDADISNITNTQMSHTISTNSNKPNESTITVSGTVLNCQSSQLTGGKPMPANSSIYIYYDTNLNYYNSTSNQSSSPANYFAWAERCAFSPVSTGCILSNPTYTWTWTDNGGTWSHTDNTTGVNESKYVTFSTQYNNTAKTTCANEPNSLLAASLSYNCNIYGKFGLPATKTITAGQAYCVPIFLNGTGHLTTQLGLVDIAKTDASGNFSKKFNVCGTGTAKITSEYYGAPPPQPMLYSQPDMSNATFTPSQFSSAPLNGNNLNVFEFNYTYSPDSAVQTFPVGIYALSYGSDDALVAFMIAMALVAFAVVSQRRR